MPNSTGITQPGAPKLGNITEASCNSTQAVTT